jgi:hypothetical protein
MRSWPVWASVANVSSRPRPACARRGFLRSISVRGSLVRRSRFLAPGSDSRSSEWPRIPGNRKLAPGKPSSFLQDQPFVLLSSRAPVRGPALAVRSMRSRVFPRAPSVRDDSQDFSFRAPCPAPAAPATLGSHRSRPHHPQRPQKAPRNASGAFRVLRGRAEHRATQSFQPAKFTRGAGSEETAHYA